jgi:hypothetical protein
VDGNSAPAEVDLGDWGHTSNQPQFHHAFPLLGCQPRFSTPNPDIAVGCDEFDLVLENLK